MPELTVPGLVLISLLPFAVVALWSWKRAGDAATDRAKHAGRTADYESKRRDGEQDRREETFREQAVRDRADWREGAITTAAVEAALAAEEWGRRGGQEGLAKTEYATARFALLLQQWGVDIPDHAEQVARLDAALTRVRPGFVDEPMFYQQTAAQGPEPGVMYPGEELPAEQVNLAITDLEAHHRAAEQSAD